MRCVLAIDSGGTKCEAILVRDDGIVLNRGHCDFADPESGRGRGGSGRSADSVKRAVSQALGGIVCEELHVTNLVRLAPAFLALEFQKNGSPPAIQRHWVREYAPALALVGASVGVVTLAGTGAFVYGKTRDGRELFLDGLGPNLGDYGGGYQIGHLAVRAAAKSGWHPRHRTSLAAPIYRACGVKEGDESGASLVPFMHGERDRAEVAAFAGLVNAEAEKGDRVAKAILEEAAAAIAETLRDLVDRLGIAQEEYVMVGIGGVARGSRVYWQHLCALAKGFAPGLKPVLAPMPQVVGVALITLQELGATDAETLRSNLFRSTKEIMGSEP